MYKQHKKNEIQRGRLLHLCTQKRQLFGTIAMYSLFTHIYHNIDIYITYI